MAIYVFSAKVIGRTQGRSVVAAAAYRSASCLTDAMGNVHDYTRKEGVVHSEILHPFTDARGWFTERSKLWLAVEQAEKRKDAQLAREVLLGLPVEMSLPEQVALVRTFLRAEFVSRGMVADVSIHADDPGNPHAHVLLTMRELRPDGFGQKRRDWNAAFTHSRTGRAATGTATLQGWRAAWERHVNHALEIADRPERVDHRTLKAQRAEALAREDTRLAARLDREPQPKRGAGGHQHRRTGALTPSVREWVENYGRNDTRRQQAAMGSQEPVQLAMQLEALDEAMKRPRGAIPEVELGR